MNIRLAQSLTYAGTLPLIACALASATDAMTAIQPARVALLYGAIIISFLAGIHWAVAIFFPTRCPRNLLLTSNMVALLAWFSLLSGQLSSALWLQALCFLYLVLLDLRLRDADIVPDWYYRLRRNATVIVVGSIYIMVGQA